MASNTKFPTHSPNPDFDPDRHSYCFADRYGYGKRHIDSNRDRYRDEHADSNRDRHK